MSIFDDLKGLFQSKPEGPTHADVLGSLRQKFPMYADMPDADFAKAAAQNVPGMSFLSDFKPEAPVPANLTPHSMRTGDFYTKNPDLGTKDALSLIEQFKSAQPQYASVGAKQLAKALEAKFPDDPRTQGLYKRLVGTTEDPQPAPDVPTPTFVDTSRDVREINAAKPSGGAPGDDRGLPMLTPSQKLYDAGERSFELGDEDGALKAWQDAARADPSNQAAKMGIERITMKRAQAQPPNPAAEAYANAGMAAFVAGNSDLALDAYTKAVAADPNHLEGKRMVERLTQAKQADAAQKAAAAQASTDSAAANGRAAKLDTSAWMTPGSEAPAAPGQAGAEPLQQGMTTYRLLADKGQLEAPSQGENLDQAAGQETLRYIQSRPAAAERLLLKGMAAVPEDAQAGLGIPMSVAKDTMVAGMAELHGVWTGITGQPSPPTEELAKAMDERKISPTIARMAGESVGGLALLSGAMAVVGAEGIAGSVGALLGESDPALTRYLAPAAAMGAGSGAAGIMQEAVRQTVAGRLDLVRMGKVALSQTGLGVAAGLAMGLPTGLLQTAGASAVGFGGALMQGATLGDAAVSALVMGGMAALAAPDLTAAHKAGALEAVRSRLRTAFGDEATARGIAPEDVPKVQAAADAVFMEGVAKAGGPESFDLRTMEKGAANVRMAAKNAMDRFMPPAPPEAEPQLSSRFADLKAPTADEFFKETPEERAARRSRELSFFGGDRAPMPAAPSAPAQDMELDGIEPHGVPAGEKMDVPDHEVLGRARVLLQNALDDRERFHSGLEKFIVENGGVSSLNKESEEFQGVPIHLRGPMEFDVMEQNAKDAGVLKPDDTLYAAIGRMKRRGPKPALADFLDQARHDLEHEYEVYGKPTYELLQGEDVPAPFEKGPGYEASSPQLPAVQKPNNPGLIRDYSLQEYLEDNPEERAFYQKKYGIKDVRALAIKMHKEPKWASMGPATPETAALVTSAEVVPDAPKSLPPPGLAEKQPGLFGGAESNVPAGKPKPEAPGQGTLFGGKARPHFTVPASSIKGWTGEPGPQAKQLAMTEEGKEQVEPRFPLALKESVVIKDLVHQGYLPVPKMRVETPADTAAIFHFLKNESVENTYALSLDENGKILGAQLVGVGTLNSTLAHPRDTLKGAVLLGAKEVVLVHNHPSGNPAPSQEDLAITRQMSKAAESVGIRLKHHVVINDTKYGVITVDDAGKVSHEVLERGAAAAQGDAGQVDLVKTLRTSASLDEPIRDPESAVQFAKGLQKGRGGVMMLALDTRNAPTGAWYMGPDYVTAKEMAAHVGRIAMRNNAASVIFVGDKLPIKSYMDAVKAEVKAGFSIDVLDFTASESKSGYGPVRSAREEGQFREGPSPYRAAAAGMPAMREGVGAWDFSEDDLKEVDEMFARGSGEVGAGPGVSPGKSPESELFAEPAENRNRNPPKDVLAALLNPVDKLNDLSLGEAGELSTLAPIRAMERMDGKRFGLMKERFLRPIQDADLAFHKELVEKKAAVEEIFKGMSAEDRTLVFDAIENKEMPNERLARVPKVLPAIQFLQKEYDTLLDRLNRERAAIGKDPIQKRANYITHYQELSAISDVLQMMGMSMTEVPASMLTISYMTKPNSPYFKFAKRRLGEKTGRDAQKAYLTYLEPALRTIHFSQAIKNGRDILEYKVKIPSDFEGGKIDRVSLFGIRYPNAYKYLTNFLNRVSGKRGNVDRLLPAAAAVAGVSNRLFRAGSIGGNIGTVLLQPSSARNVAAETGLFAVQGFLHIMTPQGIAFYEKASRLAHGRMYEPAVKGERMLGSKMLARSHDALSEALSLPIKAMDVIVVGGAFLSGYHKGKAMGLSEADAIRYGDDVAERAHGSANVTDKPPINADKIKVAISQFQTFIYNEWSQIKNDMVKQAISGESRNRQGYTDEGLGSIHEGRGAAFRRFAWFVAATILLGHVYESLGLPNPFVAEGAAAPIWSNKYTDWVWQRIINSVPGVSSVRFGGSPLLKGVLTGMAYLGGNEAEKAKAVSRLKNLGLRLIPGGGQLGKTLTALPIAGKQTELGAKARALIYGKWILAADTKPYRDMRRDTEKQIKALKTGKLDPRTMTPADKEDLRRRVGLVKGIEHQREALARIDKHGGKGPRVDALRKSVEDAMASVK